MKTFFVAVCVMALSVCAVAADSLSDWQNLSQVRVGQKIEVVQTDTVKYVGSFVKFTDDAIVLLVGKTEHSITCEQVARVSSVSHRARNSVLMGLVGLLVGGIVTGARTDDGGTAWPAVAGLGAGAAVGIISGTPTVYYRRQYEPCAL